jgi:lactate racemase
MPLNEVRVPFGADKELLFALPPDWNVIGFCEPKGVAPVTNVDSVALAAIEKPFGGRPLRELAAEATRVTVVVDDVSRPTPVHRFFEQVMRVVEDAGVKKEDVTVLTALGVHRPMTEEEMVAKIGKWGVSRYRCVNHESDPGDHLAHLGKTDRKTEVWVNKLVAEADLVVSLGCIEPHTIAGFGGGYKNLFPGVAGKVTITANHALNTTPAMYASVGMDPEKNPMRCDLEQCGQMLTPPVFVVNTVLDGNLDVVRIVAGDGVEAHRAGIDTCREVFGVPVPQQADVLITCSHPMNTDFRQGLKALANTIGALKPGGVLLNLVAAEQGLGDLSIPKKSMRLGKRGVRNLSRLLLPLVGRFSFGMKEEELFFVYFALQAFRRNDIYFFSPNVPYEFVEKMPFFDISDSVDKMIVKARDAIGGPATVLIFPSGGVTYPILP